MTNPGRKPWSPSTPLSRICWIRTGMASLPAAVATAMTTVSRGPRAARVWPASRAGARRAPWRSSTPSSSGVGSGCARSRSVEPAGRSPPACVDGAASVSSSSAALVDGRASCSLGARSCSVPLVGAGEGLVGGQCASSSWCEPAAVIRPASRYSTRSARRDRRHAVSDDQRRGGQRRRGARRGSPLDHRVDRRGGVVEQQQPGPTEQGPCQGEPLALASRQRDATLAEDLVEAGGQPLDEAHRPEPRPAPDASRRRRLRASSSARFSRTVSAKR